LFTIGTLLISEVNATQAGHDFDRTAYYQVLKNRSIEEIEKQLSLIDASNIKEKEAYIGTLLMKKADLVKKAKEKLKLFKSGRIKLETSILSDTTNTEYRFLRLIIQEHAPKSAKYSAQIDTDSDYIKKNYSKLSSDVQEIVKDYSKTSNKLHPEDF